MFNWFKKLFKKTAPKIIMIAAIQNNRGIGYEGDLLHKIQKDMKHFVEATTGHTVIMGRKSWESIPEKYRPFKNRQNIIITRNTKYQADGAEVVQTIEEAIKNSSREKIYIIGGGQIYTLALPYAEYLDLTFIDAQKPADIYFPEFENTFKLIEGSREMFDEKTSLKYEFQIWERK